MQIYFFNKDDFTCESVRNGHQLTMSSDCDPRRELLPPSRLPLLALAVHTFQLPINMLVNTRLVKSSVDTQ